MKPEISPDKDLYSKSKRYALEIYECFGKIPANLQTDIHDEGKQDLIRNMVVNIVSLHRGESQGPYRDCILNLAGGFLGFYNENSVQALKQMQLNPMRQLQKVVECLFIFTRRDLRRTKVAPEEMRNYNEVMIALHSMQTELHKLDAVKKQA